MKFHGFALSIVALLSACSSSMPTTATDSTGVEETALDERLLFSDLKELDYSSRAENYRIGIADLLDIKVFRADELSREARVDTDGNLSLPLIGTIPALGLTPVQLEQKLAAILREKYLRNPQVTVFVKEYSSQRITLDGHFGNPGIKEITAGQVSLLQAVALGGGLDDLADPGKVVLFRKTDGRVKAYRINVDDIRTGKARDPYVRNDDILVAHRSDSRYWLREVATGVGNVMSITQPFK
jgi:polysaccharide export outer membrane protein